MKALKKYLFIYLGANVAFAVLTILIFYVTGIEANNGLIITVISAMMTGIIFCKDHKRLPDEHEKKSLIRGSFLISIFLSIVGIGMMFGGYYLEHGKNPLDAVQFSTTAMLIGLFVAFGFIYLVLMVCYGWLLKVISKRMLSKDA